MIVSGKLRHLHEMLLHVSSEHLPGWMSDALCFGLGASRSTLWRMQGLPGCQSSVALEKLLCRHCLRDSAVDPSGVAETS